MKPIMSFLACFLLLCSSVHANAVAQDTQQGAVILRVPEPLSTRCIAPADDQIWLTLRRVVIDKSKGWFREDRSVGVVVDAAVSTQPPTSKPISFPLMSQATLRGFSEGQVSVPIEYTIVSGLRLKQEDVWYTGLSVEMTLLNRQGKTAWGRALQTLAETAEKLPIPPSPVTQTTSYLLDFANAAVDKDLEDQHADDKARSAALALNFDPSGQCAGSSDFERTGTLAVLQESGIRGPAYVEVGETNDYCWAAELRPAFVLKAARKRDQISCDDPNYEADYVPITNNYAGFFLNAVASSGVLGAVPEADRETALARCAAHGIVPRDCF